MKKKISKGYSSTGFNQKRENSVLGATRKQKKKKNGNTSMRETIQGETPKYEK